MSDTFAVVGLIICILLLIAAVIVLVYALTHKPNTNGPACSNDGNCGPTQVCSSGSCTEINCNKNSDCRVGQICSNNFCNQTSCSDQSDCPVGAACVNFLCTPAGQKCTGSSDCWNNTLSCSNGTCKQCSTNDDCNGQICGGDGICYSTCSTSAANSCGPGLACVNNFCCSTATQGGVCNSTNKCAAGEFCVNGYCTCQPGGNLTTCLSNNDCVSDNCVNGVCIAQDAVCAYNYSPTVSNNNLYCSIDKPYCAFGQCSTETLGAPCTCWLAESGSAATCSIYNACNVPGTGGTGTANQSISYCVNNACQLQPGGPGDVCTSSNDCRALATSPDCKLSDGKMRCNAF